YLDLLAGIAVNVLGHAHPRLVHAVSEQLAQLGHISNLFTSPQQIGLAEALLQRAEAGPGASVFFANSGTEANEAAFKLARRHGRERPSADGSVRHRVIAVEHGFHGRTLGALALTAKAAYREPFEPLPGGVEHVARGDLDALRARLDDTVAAVILEPVQGEAGVHGTPAGYLQGVRELCDEHGALLIFDEVQTGMGRTGTWFAWQNESVTSGAPVRPDAMTLAKGLGGGLPIGALVCLTARASGLLQPGQHGTTFGGNPVATAAGSAVIDAIEAESLLDRARAIGQRVATGAAPLERVAAVRHYGALIGIDLAPAAHGEPTAPAVVRAGLEAGFILNATSEHTLRLAPPLVVTDAQLDAFLQALPHLLETAYASPR
ncbi:MAG: acetylornithine transaminase, partial [Micrococcus sp.]|nr:acetylornithine transaminase [Micrococcus sp.]